MQTRHSSLFSRFSRATLMLAALHFGSLVSAAGVFQESGGVVVMDVESMPATGSWRHETAIGGYQGSGYYVWRGNNYFNPAQAGRGTIRYHFRINKPGNYQMRWRSRIAHGNNGTESNDSWIRFPTGRNINGQHGLNGWTKVYMGHLNTWSWDSYTVDHVGKQIRQYFSAGDHYLEISGRSNGHALDRISLYHYESVTYTTAKFNALNLSSIHSGASPGAAPQPQPAADATNASDAPVTINTEPAAAAPPPASVKSPPQDPRNLRLEVYSASALEVFWNAPVQNHASYRYELVRNGEILGTFDALSYYDGSLSPSSQYGYRVTTIAADGTRSRGVSVDGTTRDGQLMTPASPPATGSAPQGLWAAVYSSSAVEVFWNRDDNSPTQYRVSLDGRNVATTDGTSYFFENLQALSTYQIKVTALRSDGSVSSAASVQATTQ